MRSFASISSVSSLIFLLVPALSIGGCKKSDDQQPPPQTGYPAQQPAYGAQPQPGYSAQQLAYGQPQPAPGYG
jgi:hypothetical protein